MGGEGRKEREREMDRGGGGLYDDRAYEGKMNSFPLRSLFEEEMLSIFFLFK